MGGRAAITENTTTRFVPGMLAMEAGRCFPLEVCKSQAGYYIGTLDEERLPYTRESVEYWRKKDQAEHALHTRSWTQRPNL